jgi:hypothetical protein
MIYRQIKSQSDCLKLQEDLEAAIRWKHDWLMSYMAMHVVVKVDWISLAGYIHDVTLVWVK